MKSCELVKIKLRKTRFIDLNISANILYLESNRPGTYANIFFKNGDKKIVSYSLNYLNALFGTGFFKVNKGYLVNKIHIDSIDKKIVSIGDKQIKFSRLNYKKYKENEKNINNPCFNVIIH